MSVFFTHTYVATLLPGVLLPLGAHLLASWLSGTRSALRPAALGLHFLGLSAVAVIPAEAPFGILRVVHATSGLLFALRGWELYRLADTVPWSWPRRVGHLVSVTDSRLLQTRARESPWPWGRYLLRLGFFAGLTVAALAAVTFVSKDTFAPAVKLTSRAFLGAVAVYSLVDALVALVYLLYGIVGLDSPPVHNDPVLSKSLGEFWSQRWNRAVHRWLEQQIFRPYARRRQARKGFFLAFVVSGLLHAWLGYWFSGWTGALSMQAFFTLQGLLVLAEAPMGLPRWGSVLAQRVWTLGALFVTSPLFTFPVFTVLGL